MLSISSLCEYDSITIYYRILLFLDQLSHISRVPLLISICIIQTQSAVMDKSMIQDLNMMRSSSGPKNNFTTSFCEGGFDMRRSKISNLPGHRKSQLSLPFVVVFQTMEIERLSEQIQSLRVSLKDYEHQVFNSQNYQVQIRQLTDQCYNYDQQLQEYRDQTQKLNIICQNVYQQLQLWKQKYAGIDLQQMNRNLQILKQQNTDLTNQLKIWKQNYHMLQNSRKQQMQKLEQQINNEKDSIINRTINQLGHKFDNQRNNLQVYIQKLQLETQDQQNNIRNLQQQKISFEQQKNVKNELQWKLIAAQDQISRLANQALNYADNLTKKQEQIDFRQQNQSALIQQNQELNQQISVAKTQINKVHQLESETRDLKTQYTNLQRENQIAQRQVKKIPQLQKNIEDNTLQIQRLSWVIRSKIDELGQKQKQIQKISAKCDQLSQQQLLKFQLQKKCASLEQDNISMHNFNQSKLQQLLSTNNSLSNMEAQLQKWQQAEPQKRQICQKYHQQLNKLQQYGDTIRYLEQENSKIPEIEHYLQQQRSQKQNCINQINRLNDEVKNLNTHNQNTTAKCRQLAAQIEQLQRLREQLLKCQQNNQQMAQEITNLNSVIGQKCQKLQYIKDCMMNLQTSIQQANNIVQNKLQQSLLQNQQLITQLNNSKSSEHKLQDRLLEMQSKINQLQFAIAQQQQQKQMLEQNLVSANRQLNERKSQNSRLQTQIRQLQQKLQTAVAKIDNLQSKCNQLTSRLQKQQQTTKQLSQKCQQLTHQIEKIKISGYFPKNFRQIFNETLQQYAGQQDQIKSINKQQQLLMKATIQIKKQLSKIMKQNQNSASVEAWRNVKQKVDQTVLKIQNATGITEENWKLKLQNLELQSNLKIIKLEMADSENRKSAGTSFKTISSFSSKVTNDYALSEKSNIDNISQLRQSGLNASKISKNSFKSTGLSASPQTNYKGSVTYRC